MHFGDIQLLARERLVKTSTVDQPFWNHTGLLGFIQRLRFHLVLDLLGDKRYPRLLEIGYGSGILMPELAQRCGELLGADIHACSDEVSRALKEEGVSAALSQASATKLPYDSDSIDAVVAVSCMEFIDPVEDAAREIRRVLKDGGVFIMVTPGQSPLLDFGLKMLTGRSAEEDFAGRRELIIPALEKEFAVDARRTFPPVRPFPFHLYKAFRFRKP